MKKIAYSFLLMSSIVFGQKTVNVGDFTKVTTFDQIDVYLVPSQENKVQIEGEGSEDVEIVNKNGELKLRLPLSKMFDDKDISATVYFKNITAVEANEASRIACPDVLRSVAFDVIAKEGSEIKLLLETQKLTVRSANGSIVKISGEAKNQDVIVNSGGIYEAKELLTQQTVITGNAGGKAEIHASELVEAKIRAGGDIVIYGKPKQINQKTIAGGTIRQAN